MTNTDQYIDRNIVRILNKDGTSSGTGFFVRSQIDNKKYCVTSHHVIADLDEIYVGKRKAEMFRAGWYKEFSDIDKDLAILEASDAPYEPLECGFSVYPRLSVMVMGFPLAGWQGHLSYDKRDGTLGSMPEAWELQGKSVNGDKEYNTRPYVAISGYSIEASAESIQNQGFVKGFSGGPVCYKYNLAVLGMFLADEGTTKGYMLPIDEILERFKMPIDPAKILERANALYSKNCYADAAFEYMRIIDNPSYANDFTLWFNCAQTLAEGLGKHEQAVKCYSKALEIKPDDYWSWNNKGWSLYSLNKFEEAIECFKNAIGFKENDLVFWRNEGYALNGLKRYEEAIRCFEKATQIASNDWESWVNEGLSYHYLGKFDKAVECYIKATDNNPNDFSSWYDKGLALEALGKLDEAVQAYDRATQIDKDGTYLPLADLSDAWTNLGWDFQNLNKLDEAVKCYDRALEANQNNTLARNNKAAALNILEQTKFLSQQPLQPNRTS